MLTGIGDRKTALRFFRWAIGQNGTPEKVTIDKSGANTAAIKTYNEDHEAGIGIRQVKYLDNIVERAVKRVVRPMLGFTSFRSAQVALAGIELMQLVRKVQVQGKGKLRPAQLFYLLAAWSNISFSDRCRPPEKFATEPQPACWCATAAGGSNRSCQQFHPCGWPRLMRTLRSARSLWLFIRQARILAAPAVSVR